MLKIMDVVTVKYSLTFSFQMLKIRLSYFLRLIL